MQPHVKTVVHEMTNASDQERIAFPTVVETLMKAGVERYHADLVCATKTYYTAEGAFELTPCDKVPVPAQAFTAEGVDAAVRAIQAGTIGYREFCRQIAAAGCVGYIVTLAGRRAIYYGRGGDLHIERFP